MKWKYYPLRDGDPNAKKHFFDSFSMGASNHALSRRLTVQFANAAGEMFAIAMEALDLERVTDYRCAGTYARGQQWYEAAGTYKVTVGERSIDGLVQFLGDYLRSMPQAIVLCENWMVMRSEIRRQKQTCESHLLFYGDEVYHIATSQDVGDLEVIEAAVREPERQWLTGVCSRARSVPDAEIESETFFDEIVANTEHIFVSAFDGEGYIVLQR